MKNYLNGITVAGWVAMGICGAGVILDIMIGKNPIIPLLGVPINSFLWQRRIIK